MPQFFESALAAGDQALLRGRDLVFLLPPYSAASRFTKGPDQCVRGAAEVDERVA